MTLGVKNGLQLAADDEQQPLLLKYSAPRGTIVEQQRRFFFLEMPVWTAVATCISCLGGFLFGFDLGVVGGLFIAPSFQSHFGIDPNDKIREADINGNIVAVLQIGCLAGSLLATTTADKLGRKPSILASSAVFTLGGTLQVIGSDLAMLYAGRLIAGLGVGALSMLVPVYVAEIAHQKHRGLLGGLWQFFISAGLALSYWTNYVVQRSLDPQDDYLWRTPLIVQTVPGALLFLGMLPLFETPRSLCARGKRKQACKVIAKIRGWDVNDERVHDELELIVSGLQQTDNSASGKLSSWRLVFARQNRKRLFYGVALQMFQQMTGTNVINYYSPIIFRSIGLSSNTSELLATGVYGLVKMSVVLVGFSCLVDSFGRRPLLVGGGACMGACMISVAICVGTRQPSASAASEGIPASAYAGIVSMYAFAVFFALSWGPLPWIYCSEIFPTWMRAKSTALTTAVNWAFNAIVGKFSPIMLAATPLGTYIFFGCWCIVMSAFCYFFLPETKGKALEEIDELFTKNRVTVGKSSTEEISVSCQSQSVDREHSSS